MDAMAVDREVITRYVREYLKHGDSEELAAYLLDEVKNEKNKGRSLELLAFAITTIRNQAQGIE